MSPSPNGISEKASIFCLERERDFREGLAPLSAGYSPFGGGAKSLSVSLYERRGEEKQKSGAALLKCLLADMGTPPLLLGEKGGVSAG